MPVGENDRLELVGSGASLFDRRHGVHSDSFRSRSDGRAGFPTPAERKKVPVVGRESLLAPAMNRSRT